MINWYLWPNCEILARSNTQKLEDHALIYCSASTVDMFGEEVVWRDRRTEVFDGGR